MNSANVSLHPFFIFLSLLHSVALSLSSSSPILPFLPRYPPSSAQKNLNIDKASFFPLWNGTKSQHPALSLRFRTIHSFKPLKKRKGKKRKKGKQRTKNPASLPTPQPSYLQYHGYIYHQLARYQLLTQATRAQGHASPACVRMAQWRKLLIC